MPNTLGHIGAQLLVSRPLARTVEPRWILLGCMLPDVPWILQRAVRTLIPTADPIEVRAYVVAQGSLACTLLLCGAVAAIARSPRLVFAVLAANALLHLLLDALQSTWGSGVHLFAPFTWRTLSLGVFWPESPLTWAITALGVVMAWLVFSKRPPSPLDSLDLRPATIALAVVLAVAYLALPWGLRHGPVQADNHSLDVLRPGSVRADRPLEIERNRFVRDASGAWLHVWTRERLEVASGGPDRSGIVSLRGRFLRDGRLAIEASHLHAGKTRDYFSYAGLACIALAWLPRLRRAGK